jgi:hypothetical protein
LRLEVQSCIFLISCTRFCRRCTSNRGGILTSRLLFSLFCDSLTHTCWWGSHQTQGAGFHHPLLLLLFFPYIILLLD